MSVKFNCSQLVCPMCDFQNDYRFLNSKSSTFNTKEVMKMKGEFNITYGETV